MNDLLIDEWLTWMRAGGLSPETLRVRRCCLRRFAATHDLSTATRVDVIGYLAALPGGSWSRRGHLSSLRGFYRYATAAHLVASDPTALVRSIRVLSVARRPVPEDVLLAAIARSDDRTRTMLLLGAYAGLRRAEIASLHSSDVYLGRMSVTGKGGRTRTVPIHPLLRGRLARVDGWVFPSDYVPGDHIHPSTVGTHVADALGDPWTCHSLRRRFGARVFQASHDIRVTQELLGHASVATTQLYTYVEQDSLAAAVLAVA